MMPRTHKTSIRLYSAGPSNAQDVSMSCLRRVKEEPDLLLTGSQIHLACRPKWGGSVKTSSSRFIPVSAICSKRPMSAIPVFGHQDTHGTGETGTGVWKRPQSANISYFREGDLSVLSSATSEYDGKERLAHTVCDGTCYNNNCGAKYSLLDENVHNCVTGEKPHSREAEPDHGFGATYILPSSQLFEYVTSEPLGHTWTESELKACCEELGIEDYFCNKCEHESVSSDCSNRPCNSETSLGDQITAMAQDPRPGELLHTLVLEQGFASKPLLSQCSMQDSGHRQTLVHSRDKYFDNNVSYEDILFEKLNHDCNVTDKLCYLNQSTDSQDKYTLVSGERDGNNTHTCNMIPTTFPAKSEKGLVNNVPEYKIMTQQCSSVKDEIPMNTERSSQHLTESRSGEERQDFNEQGQNLLELKYRPFTQNLMHSVSDDVPTDLENIKVEHWLPHYVSKGSKVPNSVMCEIERQTDVLHTSLVMDQCQLDCSDSCQDLGITVEHADDINSVYTGKPRRQELQLECLVDEDIDECRGSSSLKSSGSDKKCCESNSDHHTVNVEKQGAICYMEMNITSSALLPSQRMGNKTDTEPQEMPSVCGDFEGNGSVSYNMCHGWKLEESDKCVNLYTERSVAVPENRTEISQLSRPLESPEQCRQFLHIPVKSARSLATDSTLHSNLTLGNVECDVVGKSRTPPLLDHMSVLPPPTSVAPQNYELNVSIVEPLGSSTYDDIVTILKVLEQEETCSLPKLDHLNLAPETEISRSEAFLNTDVSHNAQKISGTSGKLRDILTFLDEVECCDTTTESAKTQFQAVKDTTQNELNFAAVPRLEELLNLSTVDLAHEVITLYLQLDEKSKSINLLQRTLNQQRELAVHNARNAARDMKTRLSEQKDEYESAVARHQKFVDQLIADKKSLSEKCESLVLELKKYEEHHTNTLKVVEHRHSVELQRVREMHAAAEKLRRERWIDNKTKQIKEMTVKGLEPELQRMNTRHLQEVSDLRLLHKQELDELELRAARKTAQQMEQLRDLLNAEKEEALAREKELFRQRIERQAEQEQLEFQAQQCRLLAEIHREKERLAEKETRMNQELEETKQNLSRESAKIIERLKQEHQEVVETYTRRHQNEVKSLKEALELEKEAWMLSYKKDQTIRISERETEIHNQCKRERDKEIELIIERLESDATQSRAELEQAMDNRLRRLKEKFDAEIRDLEVSEKAIKSKYNETKGKLVEKEDEVINLKTNARQLEKELEEAKKIVDRLSAERAEMKEILRKELINQVTAAEQENIRLREEMAELRTAHKLELSGKGDEIAKMMKDKERQLQQLYNRVRLAVAKRDETIQKLKSQYESTLERCSYLEELLEQQRRDFLLK